MTATPDEIRRAAETLRCGGLVAFPTETVYGLGADARNESAVRRVFVVKGRPEGHPLIVHLHDAAAVGEWAAGAGADARSLAARFWPGPLTIVLRRREDAPDAVTGGLPTVALRVPSHPVARALLAAFGGGVAAPSANRFGRVSPTMAAHVREDLGGEVSMVLDGGPCEIGVESTIVDLSSDEIAILRPGGVPREAIERALGRAVPVRDGGPVRAPGQYPSHYAPRAEVVLDADAHARAEALRASGRRVVEVAADAGSIYAALRDADRAGADVVVVAPPPPEGIGLAVLDRLRRAAAPRGDSGT